MTDSWVALKNNERVRIQPITLKDIAPRHEFFVQLSLEQTGMVHTADEIEFHTYETEDHVTDFLKNKRGLWLVAKDDKHAIVGEVDIVVKNLTRVRHNGQLTIGVLASHQGLGLGHALMDRALSWAREEKLLRIELSVFKHNTVAQNLYRSCGFVVEGIRKNYLRHEDGTFDDDVLMAKYL